MSDLSDLLNENAGYYAALSGLAGISQRNRIVETQNRLIQQQNELARKAEHARLEAEDSRRNAAYWAENSEKEQRKVEKQRLKLESQRVANEQERIKQIRDARRCLSKLITELKALTSLFAKIPKRYSAELTVRLATLQVASRLLDTKEILEDLSDMQALAQFERNLAIFIAEKAREASTWADPAAHVQEEELARYMVVQQAIELLRESSVPIRTLNARPLQSFSKAEIKNLQDRIATVQRTLPRQLAALEKQLRDKCPCLTALEESQISVLRSMTGDTTKQLLETANLEEADILDGKAKLRGKFVKLESELQRAACLCDLWKAKVEEARKKLAGVSSAEKSGNYETAKILLNQAPKEVDGVDYQELKNDISKWSSSLESHKHEWLKTELEVEKLLSNKSLKNYFFRFSLRQNCGRILSGYLNKAHQLALHANSLPECEYKAAAIKILKRNKGSIVGMQRRAQLAEVKHTIVFTLLCLGTMIAVFFAAHVIHLVKVHQQVSREHAAKVQPDSPP